ncbi:MAG: hypothetical protein NTY15_08265 [Planctomycetota bacterium]|jgi:hypothetical protein|nr:hypothetical protein [Planctomycetota bacterium]
MKRTLVIAIPALAIMLSMIPLHGKPQEQTGKASKSQLDSFMEMKLEHSKAILEGLATENFEQIAKASQALTALSLESSWNAHTTMEYLDHSSDFRRALHVVTSAAHEENLDRAALGYVNMTVQCIECHRYLRVKQSGDAIKK